MEPNLFRIEQYAQVGSSEPFVARICCGLPEIIQATFLDHLKANEVTLAIAWDGLFPAFLSLREIREYETAQKPMVRANLEKAYNNLYSHLWAAYKDRMQAAAKMLGFDLGFLFQSDPNFEKGAAKFLEEHPDMNEAFIRMCRDDRNTWASVVGRIRNDYIEHKKMSAAEVREYFTLEKAELVFENCWTAIENILVELLRTHLQKGFDIAEIPLSERDAEHPKRFRFVATG